MQNDTSLKRPSWIKVRRLDAATRELMQRSLNGIATVCTEANCPNISECWKRGTATFMIMGDTCTRSCRFCGTKTGRPQPLDPEEPARLAEAVRDLKLKFAVLTCVDRDDLEDGGARHWAACIRAIREAAPEVGIEALTGDFNADPDCIAEVVRARPDVFAHNVEVVPSLQLKARPQGSWETSIRVLELAREAAQREGIPLMIKSGLMLGLGETNYDVVHAMELLRESGVEMLTLGQYLKPVNVPGKLEVERYVTPEEFHELAEYAKAAGFKGVASSPLTRSSHFAETLFAGAVGPDGATGRER